MADVQINTDSVTDKGTNSYSNDPRPEYTSGHGDPTNTVEKPGNITHTQADFSEAADNVTDNRERTVYQWPGVAPDEKPAKKKSSKK